MRLRSFVLVVGGIVVDVARLAVAVVVGALDVVPAPAPVVLVPVLVFLGRVDSDPVLQILGLVARL